MAIEITIPDREDVTVLAKDVCVGDFILHNTFVGWKYCKIKEVKILEGEGRQLVMIYSTAYGKNYALDDPLRIRKPKVVKIAQRSLA